ncbi:hypothetical protein PRK78_002293 [Emydomyces testavorans]|uniref:Apple domain-containing protein n=1 Tax=Emydomyces testavorans TaxID=2070801 RepID=A0AAF0DEN6_9EURO|nr:hypothetical protein PRK78_002293 [Emydomyces testavorans]
MAPIQWLLGFGILALTCPFTEAQTTAYNPGECDKDNGQYHVDTKDGQTWKIACNMQNGGTELSRTGRPNLASCIDLCSWTQGCNSVDYTPSTRVCIFYAAGTAGTTATPGTHNVYRQADPSKTQPSGSASPAPSSDAPSGSSPAPSNPPSGGSTSPSGTAPTPSTAPAQGGPSPPAPAQLTIVSNPTCPGDDGKGFVADDGQISTVL